MRTGTMTRTFGALVVVAAVAAPLGGRALAHGHEGDHMFQKMDANADGKISVDEHAAAAKTMFETMDANKDGKVTAAEMEAAHEKIVGKAAAGKDKGKQMSAAEKLKVVDTNGDGALSAEEHLAGSKAMFDKMDGNHDGFLTKPELEAGHDKLMRKAPK
jgi:Ca2+-binding EF-hand superfamily protein